jgi:hypothetical protein
MLCVNNESVEMNKVRLKSVVNLQKMALLFFFAASNENFDHHRRSSRAYSINKDIPVLDVHSANNTNAQLMYRTTHFFDQRADQHLD